MDLQAFFTALRCDVGTLLFHEGNEVQPLFYRDMLRILQDELCTVSELFDKFLFLLFFSLFNTEETVVAALHDLDKALSAGVHYACLFQDREHLRRKIQDSLHLIDYRLQKILDLNIGIVRNQLFRLVGTGFRDSKDRSFLRFHNSLIRCLYCLAERLGRVGRIDRLFISPDLAAASEELRQNDTRITSGSAQGS